MTELEDKHGVGTWIKHGATWHRSVAFDGYTHGCACGADIDAGEDIAGVQMDTDTAPDGQRCHDCFVFWGRTHAQP